MADIRDLKMKIDVTVEREKKIPESAEEIKKILCEQLVLLAENSKDRGCSVDELCDLTHAMREVVDALLEFHFR